ncbi:hypothetical protein J2X31_002237 [Flavobacterium arsenatis]|uniref:Outer membrane protein beta-barrel domain-containing protein n=1 Tax=Flavobacterium arsenatis TaxID=1484332 RepID=A0ABU1TQG6_9FLAO|nr:hypothetical protein [Flavobacterium arsenatis]MDR6968220.1 hypothetical protein [Flavobacterium arsenatis]
MKQIFTLLMLSFVLQNFAQETETETQTDTIRSEKFQPKKGRQLLFNVVSRVYYILPNQYGDHMLADAHSTDGGIGTSLSLLEYKKIRFTGGFEKAFYSVDDISKAGNFKTTNSTSIHGALSYDFKLNNHFMIAPSLGYGYNYIRQRWRSERNANQYGEHFRIGLITDYAMNKHFAFFIGIHYINSQYKIMTNQAYEDYFGKSKQVQFTLGIKIH